MTAFQSTAHNDVVEVEPIPSTDGTVGRGDQADEGCAGTTCDGCDEVLHGLNNVLASVLLNAQVMEWKLPSYSRSKRYLHEIERNAQRGGELVKRLLGRMQAHCQKDLSDHRNCGKAPTLAGAGVVAATQEPNAAIPGVDIPLGPAAHAAPVFVSHRKKVPHTIV